jgi:transposase
MMGRVQQREPKLFYVGVNLEARVPADHPLRRIGAAVDFQFVRERVRPLYGRRGNPSVDPVVLLKLMFLLYFENVRSERALMTQLPLRLDWLWFCGYDLDAAIPDHSVISKARRRWGVAVFEALFARVLDQCVAAGLVDGQVVHLDASVIRANASKERLHRELRLTGQALYETLEREVTEAEPPPLSATPVTPVDPDARLTRTGGQSVLGYKDHRVVDDRAEAQQLSDLLDQHAAHLGQEATTVVADRGYGTGANYQALRARQAKPCIPRACETAPAGMFPHAAFRYDASQDCFHCPAGQPLPLQRREPERRRHRYRARPGVCAACVLRSQCTTNPAGRTVGRNLLQSHIDWAVECFSTEHRRRLMRRRKIRAEGSFADAANQHGYKRARWRGLRRVRVQNLLIATIQNVRKLIHAGGRPANRPAARGSAALGAARRGVANPWATRHANSGATRRIRRTSDQR